MELNKIINYLNETLKINEIEDASNNGLQVGKNKLIKKVGFAVDATLESFEKAKAKNCDLLIVHHGISWADSLKYLTGVNFNRTQFLMKNDIALAAYHLPLDKHEILGHNIHLAKLLKLKNIKPFGVGYSGNLPKQVSTKGIAKYLDKHLKTECKVYNYGKAFNESVAIVCGTGGDSELVYQASKFADCYIVGDSKYSAYLTAKELGINVITAGHYETETLGLKAIMDVVNRKFKVDVAFIE